MEFNFSRNYFELFELEAQFHIDREALANRYQALQSQFHPDRFIESNDQDKRMAMQATTFINEAHKTLRDESARARYLLEMQNVTFNTEKDTTQDMNFLMAQMSLREEIDEVDSQEDPLESLDKLARQSKQEKLRLIENYQACFNMHQWNEAKEIVLKLQFFTRLQQQINQKQEALEEKLL
ncbi:MAG: Fe-S protein assembly co-chaperone HscB [Gammaproteobacteria bacterium]|nr:Fe-S protein assembly co-chaperone HscB [Gammaproteobacteria bacterium]